MNLILLLVMQEYSDMQLESSDHKFLELALKNLHNVCQVSEIKDYKKSTGYP